MLVQDVLEEEDDESAEEVVDSDEASSVEAAGAGLDDEEELACRKTAGFGFEGAAAPAGRENVVPLQQPVFWSIAVSQQ